ncbi:hypothetical protein ACFFX0_22550 [Citricoccus parietis]|uniref:Secreted protein n=1 Tax=Citricoccus parietis TaxID=592307 RepID=A0ABV5G4G7_9MICC
MRSPASRWSWTATTTPGRRVASGASCSATPPCACRSSGAPCPGPSPTAIPRPRTSRPGRPSPGWDWTASWRRSPAARTRGSRTGASR